MDKRSYLYSISREFLVLVVENAIHTTKENSNLNRERVRLILNKIVKIEAISESEIFTKKKKKKSAISTIIFTLKHK